MSDPNKPSKTSSHRRKNNSGELDVFEAARYFSGITDQNPGPRTAARMSLDIPIMNSPIINDQDNNLALDPNKLIKENKKYKQPSSPGGKIASFLNSLFNQTTSKKKKSKSKSGSKVDLEEESANARRKGRSSISLFRITTSTDHHNSNGSRTPPPCLDTPTKSYKDFRSFFDRQKVKKSINCAPDKRLSIDCDEDFRFSNGNIFKNFGFSENSWRDKEREFRKFSDFDDGGDTDSSSDLFDLPNCELDFYSSGLPVYGTTNVDKIRIARTTK